MSAARVSLPAALAAAVATTAIYVHFLIFAGFSLLEITTSLNGGAEPGRLQLLMLLISGVLGGALTAWIHRPERTARLIAAGLAICALAAALASLAASLTALLASTSLAGLGLGIATVALAGSAHRIFAGRGVGLWLGLATGAAYAICNAPVLFESAARVQSAFAAIVAGVGALSALLVDSRLEPPAAAPREPAGFWAGVAALFLLVWCDSAAFHVIQHDSDLKSASWSGAPRLWTIAALHLTFALLAGRLIDSGRTRATLALAGALLAAAIAAFITGTGPDVAGHLLYPAAVSLYSVVLVALPSFARGTSSPSTAPARAAVLFGIAGWLGSAAGIGAAMDLGRTALWPAAIASAALVGILAWKRPWRSLAAIALVAAVPLRDLGASAPEDPVARGRSVYIAEGCIHCHSQFVRPGTPDELVWGPAAPLDSALRAAPPLFGNRRQGPDLQNVGLRRSREWNRLHLIDPRSLSPGSRMPSYAHLFADDGSQGEALLDYLSSLGEERLGARIEQVLAWKPGDATEHPEVSRGRELFQQNCAQCHGNDGRGHGPLAAKLASPPRDLASGEWHTIPRGETEPLARVIKFGVAGTSMPGHESLPDPDIGALTGYVRSLSMHAKRDENPPG